MATLFEKAKQLTNGAIILTEWLGEGGHTVGRDLAQERANICLDCPQNMKEWPILETVADKVKQIVQVKNHLQLRVSGERRLHVCSGCSCALRTKIWLPLEKILPEPEERRKFDKSCWLLNESKP